MRTLVHLSDVHFGRVDYDVVEGLIETVAAISPHLTVISGDLTQRARSSQFVEAREFLNRLPQPQIVVPGNHDIPLYNFIDRFAQPLDKYKRYITSDLRPIYLDDEIAVLGINTARSLTRKYGRINESQIRWIKDSICDLPDEMVKIIVTHHPFDVPEGVDEHQIVGRAKLAMKTLAECGADVFLAGHLHLTHIGHTATRYKIAGHSALVIQAGTATSTRGRGETNSFNILKIENSALDIERCEWDAAAGKFVVGAAQKFFQTAEGWKPAPQP